mgnify:CR=1 FL=1
MKLEQQKLSYFHNIQSLSWFRTLEVLFVVLAIPMGIVPYILLYDVLGLENFALCFLVTFFLSYFFADIFSGCVHWFADHFGDEHTPIIGKNFILPFRVHHEDPKLMTKISLWENLGSSCMLSFSLQSLMILYLLNFQTSILISVIFLFLNSLFIFTSLSNLFHRWAHFEASELSSVILFLQKYHIILNPKSHDIHHNEPFDQSFCVTNNWANPLLNKINFWKKPTEFLRLINKK